MMKKFLALFIGIILILQTIMIPVAAQDAPDLNGLIDVASVSAAFASTWKSGYGAENTVDGDPGTFWISADSNREHRFVLDLGAEYVIDTIGYLPQNDEEAASGFEVYLSNDNEFLDKTLVYSQGDSAAPTVEKTYLTVDEQTDYRYVVVEKPVSAGKLGIAEINVYVQDNGYELEREATYYHVNNNMKGHRYGGSPSGLSANTFSCSTDVGLKAFHTSNGNPLYFMFDLGAAQSIGYVTYSGSTAAEIPSENDLGHRTDFKVIGSNNSDYSDYDVLATQVGLAGNPDSNYSGMILYKTDEMYKDNKYRYVGIIAEKMVGGKVRFAVNSLNIFAAKTVVSLKEKVNVAVDCAAFASTYASGSAPQNAVDGNPETAWMSGNSVGAHSFVLDLGQEYPVSVIGYTSPEDSEYAGGFNIYGANSNQLTDRVILASQGSAAELGKETHYATPDESMYRYILVEKSSTAGKLGIGELSVYVHQDYLPDVWGENNRVIHINNGLKAMRSGGTPSGMTANVFTSEDNTSMAVHDSDGSSLYMIFDLGTPQKVSHIAYAVNTVGLDEAQMDNRSNFKFIGTNDPSYQTYDVLVTQNGLAGMPNVNYSGLIVYETDSQFADTEYRYVGALAEDAFSGKVRFATNTMNFYTKSAQMSLITMNSLVAVMDDTQLNVKGSALTGTEGSFIFSAFDKNHQYLGSMGAENVLENGGTTEFNVTVDFGYKNIAAEDIESIQMIVIDNLTSMNLLMVVDDLTDTKDIWSVDADSATAYEETVTRNTQTYNINGSTDAPAVVALILKEGASFDWESVSEIRYAEAQKPNENGEFVFSFTFSDTDEFGEYEMKIGTGCSEDFGSPQVHILENLDTTELVEAFRTVSAADFSEMFDEYSAYFSTMAEDIALFGSDFGKLFVMIRDEIQLFDEEISEIDSVHAVESVLGAAIVAGCVKARNDYDDIISRYVDLMPDVFGTYYDADEFEGIMSEVKKHIDLDSAENFAEAMKRAVGLSLIQNGNYDEIVTALKEYSDALGISEETLDTKKTKLQIAKELDNTKSDVKGYAAGMDDEISDIIDRLESSDKNSSSSGGSGGGGGGSSYRGYPAEPVKTEAQAPVELEKTVVFNDLGGYDWAKDAIGNLASRNILKGKSEGVFDPESAVTREEVVKLLVLVFGFDMSENENSFVDCDKNSWYYPYVTAAREYAVVNGISSTEFGVGTNVTRQDLATMIYRALDKVGFDCEEVTLFEDNDDIADYAKYGVSVLATVGVVKGFENGCFMPENNTTRAEAAVIFDRALKLLEKKDNNQ